MAKSIMEPKKCRICYICGGRGEEEHHVFFGTANRRKSEKWGLKVHLCCRHHREEGVGIHGGNQELDRKLKRKAQEIFEQRYGRERFLQEFGRNYLDAEPGNPEEKREKGPQGQEPAEGSGFRWISEEIIREKEKKKGDAPAAQST